MASRILEVILQAKDQATAVIGKAESSIQSSTSKMASAFKLVAAAAASLAIGKFLKESVQEAIEAERGMARLGVAVRNAGGNFDQLRPALESTVTSLTRLTTYTDDDLRAALTNMVTLTGDVAGSQKNLALVADLAAARQIDLSAASDLVSKAMNGNVTGLNKLGFAGKDTEAVLANLAQSVGGFAEREAKTFGGSVTQLTKAWDDFKEAVGLAIISGNNAGGALGGLTEILARVSDFISENQQAIGAFVDALFALGSAVWQLVRVPLKVLLTALAAVTDFVGTAMEAIGTLIEKGGSILAKFGLDVGTSVGSSLKAAGQAMQTAALEGAKAIWGIEKKSQADQTAVVAAGGASRVKLTKQEQADREKAAKDHAKKIASIEVEIATYALAIERGITKDKAKELIQRELDLGRSLGVQVGSLESGYQRLDALRAKYESGWTRHLQTIVDSIAQATPKVVSSAGRMIEATGGMDGQLASIATVAKTAKDGLASLGDAQDRAADKAAGLRDELRTGITAATGFASGLGLISDAAANVVNQLVAIGTNIGKALSGDATSIAAVLGGLTTVLGQLFGGESPEEKARKELVRRNSEALRELTSATIDATRLQQPGRNAATIAAALSNLQARIAAEPKNSPLRVAPGLGLAEELQKLGLTMADYIKFAQDFGIDTGPGGMALSGLQSVEKLLSNGQFGFFGGGFAGALEAIRAGLQGGTITQGQEFSRILGAVQQRGPNAISAALEGIDFTSAPGRESALGALRELLTQITTGSFTAQQLSTMTGGLNPGQFADALQQLIAILADPARAIEGLPVGVGTPDTPPLNLSTAFGDLSVAFEDIGTQQVDYLASIDTNIGQLLTRWTDIDTGQAVGLAAAPVTITVGDINIASATDPTATAEAVQRAVSEALNQALADSYRDRLLATGDVTRTVT